MTPVGAVLWVYLGIGALTAGVVLGILAVTALVMRYGKDEDRASAAEMRRGFDRAPCTVNVLVLFAFLLWPLVWQRLAHDLRTKL